MKKFILILALVVLSVCNVKAQMNACGSYFTQPNFEESFEDTFVGFLCAVNVDRNQGQVIQVIAEKELYSQKDAKIIYTDILAYLLEKQKDIVSVDINNRDKAIILCKGGKVTLERNKRLLTVIFMKNKKIE